MHDKRLQRLKEIAEKKLANGISREEALLSLQRAGHLDVHGNFTAPYQHLARAVEMLQKNETSNDCLGPVSHLRWDKNSSRDLF